MTVQVVLQTHEFQSFLDFRTSGKQQMTSREAPSQVGFSALTHMDPHVCSFAMDVGSSGLLVGAGRMGVSVCVCVLTRACIPGHACLAPLNPESLSQSWKGPRKHLSNPLDNIPTKWSPSSCFHGLPDPHPFFSATPPSTPASPSYTLRTFTPSSPLHLVLERLRMARS